MDFDLRFEKYGDARRFVAEVKELNRSTLRIHDKSSYVHRMQKAYSGRALIRYQKGDQQDV